jgi:Arc/MetJ-type ribon-helix-helix transcriptional regulator
MSKMKSENKQPDHVTIKIPQELIEEMDKLKGVMGFRSRGEIAKEAIRQLLSHYKETLDLPKLPPLPRLEHFNISENGVRILDRSLGNGVSKGRIIDVYFRPENAWCEYCQSTDCEHVEFALSIPKVQKILIEKGWPISKKIKEE